MTQEIIHDDEVRGIVEWIFEHSPAAELLKQVEVLPEGSEPQVGDLVLASYHDDVFVHRIVDGKLDDGTYQVGGFDGYGFPNMKNTRQIHKIIQRSGRPVIIEKEGV